MLNSVSNYSEASRPRSFESPLMQFIALEKTDLERSALPVQPVLPTLVRHSHVQTPQVSKPLHTGAKADCSNCPTRPLCMPIKLRSSDLDKRDTLLGSTRKVERGEAIYRAGDPFRNLYVARAGSSKTVVVHRDGREQITGFQIAGEFLGMDGIGTGVYTADAIALEDGLICVIPFKELEEQCGEVKELQHLLHRLMSREIVRESSLLMLMGNLTAEERVATFLTNLSQRFRDRGYSPSEFNLRMTREEIGCHLGLKLETVSRMFTKLQRRGLIDMHGKQVRIVDIEGLDRI
jgi:CRP/FNR family transcriptional regulator